MRYFWMILVVFSSLFYSCQQTTVEQKEAVSDPTAEQELRIVSLSGSLTELSYALGLGDEIVGVDVTSSYPEEVKQLPKLGHVRQLNLEGLIALNPDYVLIDAANAELPAVQQLKQHPNIKLVTVDLEQGLDAPIKAAKALDQAFAEDLSPAIQKLEQQHKAALEKLSKLETPAKKAKVLFLYARGSKTLMVGGKNTAADKMIALAQAENAVTEFEDFRALTPEAVLQAAPDIILMFDSGLASLADETAAKSSEEVLFNLPALAQTPAGKAKRLITMDGHYLLGFGPRVASAVYDLRKAIEQELAEQL